MIGDECCVLAITVMFIKVPPAPAEEERERRGSVSNWFLSLRRNGRRKREDNAVPANYGSLGRRKDGNQARGKTRSAWDLTTVTRMVCMNISLIVLLKVISPKCTFWENQILAVFQTRWINSFLNLCETMTEQ